MHFRTLLLAMSAIAATIAPALADVKIVQVTSVQIPGQAAMLQRLPPEARAEVAKEGIGAPMRSVIYISGNHMRVDLGGFTTLVDTRSKTITTVNRQGHNYTTRPFESGAGAGQISAIVKKTGRTKIILGHLASLYHVVTTGDSGATTADIWATHDLPRPPSIQSGGPIASLTNAISKIDGMPLSVTIHTTMPSGSAVIVSNIKSIANGPIPGSAFKIPAGYRPAAPGAGVGAPSFLGH